MNSVPEQNPTRRISLYRLTGLGLGFALLVWLPFEDQSELWVLIFAAAICTWLAARFLRISPLNDRQLIVRHALVGLGAGLILGPVAMLLMAIKSGIHGHGTPDFSVAQLQSVLARTFYFALSGILIGSGIGVWRLARRQENK
jgi:hypothetical protein